MSRAILGVATVWMQFMFSFSVSYAGEADENLKVMVDAARKMDYILPENRAYLLIKKEVVISPIGIIFGYVDNAAACQQLAEVLSSSGRVGTFDCSAIF